MSHRMDHLAGTFEAAAERFPGSPAVIMPDGSSLTYAELDDRADRMAGYLQSLGIGPGDRVGLTVPKSFEAVTTILATLKCGAAYVPSDWTAPDARGRSIMTDGEVKALLIHPRAAGLLDEWTGERPQVLLMDVEGSGPDGGAGNSLADAVRFGEVLRHDPIDRESVTRDRDALSYILYTSGSTGVPKGVMITHRNALSFVDWCSKVFEPTEDDRFSSHAPFHFDLSILDLHVAWKHGASVHIIPDDLGKSPKELVTFAGERDLTVWYSTPSTLALMLQYGGLEKSDWAGPRHALFAGEVFPVKHLRRMTELWRASRWFNLYGPTETNVCTFHEVIPPIPADVTDPPPIGKPCGDHTVAMIADADGVPVPDGEEGTLWISGDCVFQGYRNRPEENAAAFLEKDGVRWYDTRDIVVPDATGALVYKGRRDRMVKRMGYRIELGEVESALYKHKRITKAAAIALQDSDQGVKIVACCVADGDNPSLIEMKKFCHDNLPAYMVPDSFNWRDDLPLTSTDKIDYQGLIRDLTGA
ncbi:MAG: amino acid adenylation domain-containing protein [Gemmatimonadetes bacterium]|nr:amino acid adenylation domain-containing protein [Gemmatimonadota bacterium]